MKKAQQQRKGSVNVAWVKNKYKSVSTCSSKTIKKYIFKPLRQKYLHRSKKPAVPRSSARTDLEVRRER